MLKKFLSPGLLGTQKIIVLKLFNLTQRLFKIGNNIVNMFEANRDAQCARLNTSGKLGFLRKLLMRRS